MEYPLLERVRFKHEDIGLKCLKFSSLRQYPFVWTASYSALLQPTEQNDYRRYEGVARREKLKDPVLGTSLLLRR